MRPEDAHSLIRFNTRMGLFVCPVTRSNVEAFLHGYQYGTASKCQFTEILSEHITKRYRIRPTALGWSHQIAQLAEKRSLDWMEAYLLVSSELLGAALESTKARAKPRRTRKPATE